MTLSTSHGRSVVGSPVPPIDETNTLFSFLRSTMSHVDVLGNDAVRNLVMPISVKLYHALCSTDAIAEKTELIEGVIVKKVTKSPLHAFVANELRSFFEASLPDGYVLRKEDPITLLDSEPEPDIALVKGRRRDFISSHPSNAELVIEIAVSSVALDRQKAAVYAAAEIPEYWLVLPEQRCVEIYSNPLVEERKYTHEALATAEQSVETICGKLSLRSLFS